MREPYSVVRQIKKIPQSIPGKVLDQVFHDLNKEEANERHTVQRLTFQQSESTAKNIVDDLPLGTTFTIRRRCDQEPSGEISYSVNIKNRDDKKVKFGPKDSDIFESRNYLGFCLETQLMIRDQQGNPIKNQELIEKLNQTHTSLPQTRQIDA